MGIIRFRNDENQTFYGTKAAFDAYVSCLHQLYLFGAAMQFKRMGYHMTKMQ